MSEPRVGVRDVAKEHLGAGCALVTGASRGIGAASAVALSMAGWRVIVNYRRDADGAEETVARITAHGGAATAVEADVTDPEATERMFLAAEDSYGRVLVLVNNAGIRCDDLLPQITDEAWASVLQTNLTSPFMTMRRAIPSMMRARFGRIVNIASIVGPTANAGQANYAAAKAGLIALTKTAAVEVARRRITVNAVAPGYVRTRLTEDVSEGLIGRIPARTEARPEEIAACVRFLASAEASYVTGAVLVADGGLSA